jgi:hypothetical protein
MEAMQGTHEQSPERILGRLEGRVSGLEDWMHRHEAANAARLASIEVKLDRVVGTLSEGLGGLRIAHWLIGVVLLATGWLVSHFLPGSAR